MAWKAWWGALVVALLVVGCRAEEETDLQAPLASEPPSGVEDVISPADSPVTSLGLGMARIVVHQDGRISVAANDARRLEILGRLSKAAGFDLEVHVDSSGRMTAQLERRPLREILPLLAGDLDYVAEWSFDERGDRYVLTMLTIGIPLGSVAVPQRRAVAPTEASESAVVTENLRRILDERPAMHLDPDELVAALDHPDPRVRMEVVVEVDPDGQAFDRLIEMLARDPDAGVRAATTASLENSDRIAAVNALIEALNDPSPAVVVEVIDALEFAGDASIVPQLRPLLEHHDPRVRDIAAEAIAFLEDPDDEP